jgi:hypothetical protein
VALGRVEVRSSSSQVTSICQASISARARNSPAAPGLERQCRALQAQAPAIDAHGLAGRGAVLAADDPDLTALRGLQPDGPVRTGFDIGLAVVGDDTAWGPGKQAQLDAVGAEEQLGFKIAATYAMDHNRNRGLAVVGRHIASQDAELADARGAISDPRFWLGFDIATGIFGDPALGAKGAQASGPGSLAIRDGLSLTSQQGFNAAMRRLLGHP